MVGAGPVVPQAGGRGTPRSGQGGQGGAGDPREDIAARDTGRAPANQIVEAVTVHGCSFRWAADTAVEPRAIRRAPRGWSMGDRRITASSSAPQPERKASAMRAGPGKYDIAGTDRDVGRCGQRGPGPDG